MRFIILAFLLFVFAGVNATVTIQQIDPFLKVLPNSDPAPFSIVQSVAHGDHLIIQLVLKNDANEEFSDAIALFVEHREGTEAYEFVHPYTLQGKEDIRLEPSFGNTLNKQIF